MSAVSKKISASLLNPNEKLLGQIRKWAAFYRANPHRFAIEVLNMPLKPFQQVLIYAMMVSNTFVFIASRGLGKTYLVAAFCIIRCILYPDTKITIAAGSRKQAREIIGKISNEFMPMSEITRSEIASWQNNLNEGTVHFKNGSYIVVVTANENARGARANILINDEYRMIRKNILDGVLKKFLSAPRIPRFLNTEKYKDKVEEYEERNKEIYMTSAWYQSHWAWDFLVSSIIEMAKNLSKTFVVSLPYQLAIKEGLYSREYAEEEMRKSDFNELQWQMEMECKWFGEQSSSLFKLNKFLNAQKIYQATYPKYLCNRVPNKALKYNQKKPNEVRLLSVDVALAEGSGNDNTVISLLELTPTNQETYLRKVTYSIAINGGRTDAIVLQIRRLFEHLDCDYIVLDTRNAGRNAV